MLDTVPGYGAHPTAALPIFQDGVGDQFESRHP